MNGWLLDTNIVSLFAPKKDGGLRITAELANWFRKNSDRLFLPAIAISEIRAGTRKLRRSGGERRADELEVWLTSLVSNYGDRALPIDINTALLAGDLSDNAEAIGRHPGLADILVAATAQRNRLDLLTSNAKHFEPLGLSIQVQNPIDQLPKLRG